MKFNWKAPVLFGISVGLLFVIFKWALTHENRLIGTITLDNGVVCEAREHQVLDCNP